MARRSASPATPKLTPKHHNYPSSPLKQRNLTPATKPPSSPLRQRATVATNEPLSPMKQRPIATNTEATSPAKPRPVATVTEPSSPLRPRPVATTSNSIRGSNASPVNKPETAGTSLTDGAVVSPVGKDSAARATAEDASRLLEERRRLERLKADVERRNREEQERRLREEREKEEKRKKEEKEKQEQCKREAKEQEEKRLKEEREREEKQQREEKEKEALALMEKKREELQKEEERHRLEEQERQQRKKRIEEIMKRTRKADGEMKKDDSFTEPTSPVNLATSPSAAVISSPSNTAAKQPEEKLATTASTAVPGDRHQEVVANENSVKEAKIAGARTEEAHPKANPSSPIANGIQAKQVLNSDAEKSQGRILPAQPIGSSGTTQVGEGTPKSPCQFTSTNGSKKPPSPTSKGKDNVHEDTRLLVTPPTPKRTFPQQGKQPLPPKAPIVKATSAVTNETTVVVTANVQMNGISTAKTPKEEETQSMDVSPVSKEDLVSIPEFSPLQEEAAITQNNSTHSPGRSSSPTRALLDLLDLTGHVAYPCPVTTATVAMSSSTSVSSINNHPGDFNRNIVTSSSTTKSSANDQKHSSQSRPIPSPIKPTTTPLPTVVIKDGTNTAVQDRGKVDA